MVDGDGYVSREEGRGEKKSERGPLFIFFCTSAHVGSQTGGEK